MKNKLCHDCGVKQGELHVSGCDVETCSKCRTQWIQCGCENVPPVPFGFEPTNQNDLWLEFFVERGDLIGGRCGLCGNNGLIDVKTKDPRGIELACKGFCICPNGRSLKDISGE